MHGTVCLDEAGEPVRPAIIWADTRSRSQVDRLSAGIGRDELARHAPGPPVAGFMGPTLMWLASHEPHTLDRTRVLLLPKDVVRLRLTGELATDITDAAATWLFDVASLQWSAPLLARCGVDPAWLPRLLDPVDVAGSLRVRAADALGLPAGIPVVAGCADQPAQALGHGIVDPGVALLTLGTGGQVFHPLYEPRADPGLSLHVFNHAVPDRWYALAAILSAGLALCWLGDLFGLQDDPCAFDRLSELAGQAPPGADGLVFLPYLAGERTLHMDARASGGFIGLRSRPAQANRGVISESAR